jgi:hypothetical protein
MRLRPILVFIAFSMPQAMLACGARTGLLVPYPTDAEVQPDVHQHEAGPDVVDDDAPEFPPLDAAVHDVYTLDCPPETFIYVVATDNSLLRFDPPSATFTKIATLDCIPNNTGPHPFSMAVDRKTTAYVEYDNGQIFQVSTIDGSCQTTPYLANADPPFSNFGMGYATIGFGPAEQLFISADAPGELGMIDTVNAFAVDPVAIIQPEISWGELTGSGDGRLYTYYSFGFSGGSYVAELDKTSGAILGQDYLPTVDRGLGWAFAYWGGDFYIFANPSVQNTWYYSPATKQANIVAHYSAPIVGAGVSTCAPQ